MSLKQLFITLILKWLRSIYKYLIAIDKQPVHSVEDALSALTRLADKAAAATDPPRM